MIEITFEMINFPCQSASRYNFDKEIIYSTIALSYVSKLKNGLRHR